MRSQKKSGKGWIVRRPSGLLMIGYYAPLRDGSWGQVRESAKTTDEDVARELLDERLRQVKNHEEQVATFSPPSAQRITVGELLDAAVADRKLRGCKSAEKNAAHLGAVRAHFGKRRAVTVTGDDVRRFVEKSLKDGYANATVNRQLENLNAAYELAVKEKLLAPASKPRIVKLKPAKPRQGFFEHGDFERLLRHLPEPVDDMVRLAYATGWRSGEVLALEWSWVDRDAREVRLPDSKNGEPRFLPLDDALWAIFERAWKRRKGISPAVFQKDGRKVTKSSFRQAWQRGCVAAGFASWVPDRSRTRKARYVSTKVFHDFRRTAARNMIRAGVAETVAMRVTGHKTRSMFDRYNIVASSDVLDALAKSRAYVETGARAASGVVVHLNGSPRGVKS